MNTETNTAPATEKAMYFPEKYKGKYGKDNRDWLGALIDGYCLIKKSKEVTTKAEDGTETTEVVELKGTALDIDRFFEFCEANTVDASKFREQIAAGLAVQGRARMTLGNSLRALARNAHGLYVPQGDGTADWTDAPEEFTVGFEKKLDKNFAKIAKVKPTADAAENAEGETADGEANETAAA